jgi:hypothetical protein
MTEVALIASTASPAPPSVMKARLDVARTAVAEIKAAHEEAAAHRASLEAMAAAAVKLASSAIILPDTHPTVTAVPRADGGETLVVAAYPARLEEGFPTILLLMISVKTTAGDGAVVARGCGVYGSAFMPNAAQLPQVFATELPGRAPAMRQDMADMIEEIWRLPLDSEILPRKVAAWTEDLFEKYVQQTEPYIKQLVAYHRDTSDAQIRGTRPSVSSPMMQPIIFNSKEAKRVHVVQWRSP